MSHAGHHTLSMYDSAWQRRGKNLWLAIGLSAILSTLLATSSLFYPSPRQMVTHFLETHVQAPPSSADRFVAIAQDVDIGGALDLRPLGALCANRTWRDGLVFRLADTTGGGMGNVKNAFLNSLRFAIEAGASYVMPRMFHRDPCDVRATHTGNLRDFSYLFDRAHFKSSMKAACPMMTIYDDFSELEQYPWAVGAVHLTPNSLDDIEHGYWLAHPHEWRSRFDTWLETEMGAPSAEEPLLVTLDHAFLLWPILSDPPALVRTFGRVLRSPTRVRRLAARVQHSLSVKHNIALNPQTGIATPPGYFGMHLRTAADAVAVGWAGYGQQASAALTAASAANFSLMYAASGDPDHLAQLAKEARDQYGITVTTKTDLLCGEDREELTALSWDQQALVDYEVLLRSSFFAGLQPSSFSYSIAVKRHSALMSHEVGERWKGEDLDPGQRPWWSEKGSDSGPHDSLSTLLGERSAGYLFESTIWP